MFKKTLLSIFMFCLAIMAMAQTSDPVVIYYNKGDLKNDTLRAGGSSSMEAPLDITCQSHISYPSNYSCNREWKIYKTTDGEDNPIIERFDDDITYTLTTDGTFNIKLYVTFYDAFGNEFEDNKEFSITIAGSKLTVPDGFSPNDDNINDCLRITSVSLVRIKGAIFNRWGQKIVNLNLESLVPAKDGDEIIKYKYDIWDGRVNGKYVSDGVYFINFDAEGSDGIHYKVKKAINVLKGYRENTEGGNSDM